MNEFETLVLSIETHSKRLVNEKASLIDENKRLKENIQILESLIEQKDKHINELKEKNEVIRIAKTLEVGDKGNNSKKKIKELVQEIDKCITLLNR